MPANIDAKIDLDNKTTTKTLDKYASDFLDNLGNLFVGRKDGDRADWVKKVHDHFAATFPSYGIMVIHKGQDRVNAPANSYKHFHLEYKKLFGTEGFEIYVIKRGSGVVITNSGDGGYINWRFSGAKKRDGSTVTF